MVRSRDEAFSLYPLIAQSIDTDAERTYVEFTLDPRAKFSDGTPITPGRRDLLAGAAARQGPAALQALDRRRRQDGEGRRARRAASPSTTRPTANRRCCLALLPILPKHATDAENFDKSTLKPLIASGPYRIDSVRPGEVVVLKRNPDYWAKDIPSKRGFDNYDEIRINYYRDENTMFEAFKKGALDIQLETDTGRWATGYNFPAATDGRIAKDTFKSGLPSGMYGFVLNTRRDVFKDRDVRLALGGLFDFEWANKNLFSGAYQRTRSYYDGSELSSFGTPASEAEKALLQPYADKLLPEIMAGTWTPPASDGSGRDRAFLKKGFDALKKAGYELEGRHDDRPRRQAARLRDHCSTASPARRSPAPGSVRWRSSASPSPSAPSTARNTCSGSASMISTPC